METNYNLRTSDFVIPRYNTETCQIGANGMWRKLPRNVRTQGDLNSFKKQIKKMDLEFFAREMSNCFFYVILKL